MDKPTKPTDLVPRSFGGVKNNFSSSLQASGYEDGVPAIYGGDNLNYQLDATGQELDYCEKICDFINALPIGKVVTVDENNKLIYNDLAQELPIATTSEVGVVKPDGESILVDENGVISANLANLDLSNLSAKGLMKIETKPFAVNAIDSNYQTILFSNTSSTTEEIINTYNQTIFTRKFTSDTSNYTNNYNIPINRATRITGTLINHKTDSSYGSKTCYVYAVFDDNTTELLTSATSNGSKVTKTFDVTFSEEKNIIAVRTVCNTAANGSVPQTVTTTLGSIYYNTTVYSGTTAGLNPCILTDANLNTYNLSTQVYYNFTTEASGTYYLLFNTETKNIEITTTLNFYNYLPSTMTGYSLIQFKPLQFYYNNTLSNNYVYLGSVNWDGNAILSVKDVALNANYNTEIDNKADVDLTNVNNQGKQFIVNQVLLDLPANYNPWGSDSPYAIPWNTAYRLPVDASLLFSGTNVTSGTYLQLKYSINGTDWYVLTEPWKVNAYGGIMTGPVARNTYVKAVGGTGSYLHLTYVPVKGANQ